MSGPVVGLPCGRTDELLTVELSARPSGGYQVEGKAPTPVSDEDRQLITERQQKIKKVIKCLHLRA